MTHESSLELHAILHAILALNSDTGPVSATVSRLAQMGMDKIEVGWETP